MEVSQFLATMRQLHGVARERGVLFLDSEDTQLQGRALRLRGQDVISFSSCSYLGLEQHPALIAGVHRAVDAYGTQFSTSRGYVSAPPYAELEAKLSTLFGGHALVTSSTSLGHQAVLSALLTEKDAIVLDHQVHHSVHMASRVAQAAGAAVCVVRHSDPEDALRQVARLSQLSRRVWYACDGVFSMYGDLASMPLLTQLLRLRDNVYLYVDDAHGMSWAGQHGRGSFLSRMPMHERLVLATSLNKAFSAAGGCMVFPTAALREEVLDCGGPMVFSGPVQPPMLGAALASADLHLSPEITGLQAALAERTALCNRLMRAHGLPLLVENEAPIFFVQAGLPRVAFAIAERMMADGFYVNVSVYPAVPMKRAGIRFSVTAAHTLADITAAVERLAVHHAAVLEQEELDRAALEAMFDGAIFEVPQAVPEKAALKLISQSRQAAERGLVLHHHHSIDALDAEEWDRLLGPIGACSAAAQRTAEALFRRQPLREHCWDFHYLIVRDAEGKAVAATFCTTFLNKDDMLMRDQVSQEIERRRQDDPYFLTSRTVGMGSGFSEGNHLYLDRSGPWQDALALLLTRMEAIYDREEANMLLLRDLPADDAEMDEFLIEHGLVKVPMFDSHYVHIDWSDAEGFLAGLTSRKRSAMRKILQESSRFERLVVQEVDKAQAQQLYALYRNVSDRKRKLNVFPLPPRVVEAIVASPAWELVSFTLPVEHGGPEDGQPVAWYGAHIYGDQYAPFLCGLNYDYVKDHGAYRQMLYQMLERARELGCRRVHLGMDADIQKSRMGSYTVRNCVYVRVREHFNGVILQDVVAQVGLEKKGA